MPIVPLHPVHRLSQEVFNDLAYGVMRHIFEIHNEFGRFFDERIYKRELAFRFSGVELEFPIVASHGTYSTTYCLDALIGEGGAFEFKTTQSLTPRDRVQLYNYLLLLDLAHGKLVNLRPENVCHEFVNATLRPADRQAFEVCADRWDHTLKGSQLVMGSLLDLLRDWGVGLELGMYEQALTHFLGGEKNVLRDVPVLSAGRTLGCQSMRLAADGVALRLTGFESHNEHFEDHARRLLLHIDLRAILWVNIALRRVTFTSIKQGL
jgi:GxxExxY protein